MVRTAPVALALVALVGCSRAQWEDSRFRFVPMPASASEETLLGPGEWDREGAVEVIATNRETALRFRAGEGGAEASIALDARPSTLYELTLEYQLGDGLVVPRDPTDDALEGWFTPRPTKTGAIPLSLGDERPGWHLLRVVLFTPPDCERVSVSLSLQATRGSALLRGGLVRALASGGETPRWALVSGDRAWGDANVSPEPGTRPDAARLYASATVDALPRGASGVPRDALDQAVLRGCPGEVVVARLGLYAPRALEAVALEPTALRAASGRGLPASAAEVRAVRFWPRRTDYYGRGNTWKWVADAYLPAGSEVAIAAGGVAEFVLRVRIPEDAAPGEYEGEIRGAASIPVLLTVRPFGLAEATTARALYTDFGRWREMSDEQVLAELRDLREHGITALTLPCRGSWQGASREPGAWQWDREALRGRELAWQAGFRGPFLLQLEKELDDTARELGISAEAPWSAAMRTGVEALFRAVVAEYRAQGRGEPVFVGIDEPGYWKDGSPEAFREQLDAARRAGISSYCTSSYLPDDPLGAPLTYHCYGGMQRSLQRALACVTESRAAGQEPWCYAAGAYPGQIGLQGPNRWLSGFLPWSAGFTGQAFWTLQRPRGDAYDDFSGDAGQPCITLPDPNAPGESLDTPQWEGLRQGWIDERYVRTLEARIAEGAGSAQARGEASALLARIRETLPWSPDAVLTEGPEATDALRERVAEMIELLGAEG